MNKYLLLLITLGCTIASQAMDVSVGKWTLKVSDTNGKADVYCDNVEVIPANSGVFKDSLGTEYVLSNLTYQGANVTKDYSDAFGKGEKIDLTYLLPASGIKATHTYYLYDNLSYILTDLKIEYTSGSKIASNYMSPLYTATSSTFLPARDGSNAVLVVPFDNDCWVTYSSNIFRNGASHTSYEATCIYNINNGEGLVVGSVEHTQWKTGILLNVSAPNVISSMMAFGGISDNKSGSAPTTRDQLPHGKVKGAVVKSPKIMIGVFADWRKGMETYGEANAIVAPKLPWTKGVPFGWNSWGNAQGHISYAISNGVSTFYADNLYPEFSNDSTVYIGLDSYWDRLTAQNRRTLINNCHQRGQKIGIYWTPFVDWNGSDSREVEGTNGKYTYGDIHLKINGKSAEFPGGGKGYALDPTHPGTKMRIDSYLDQWKKEGYDYVKLDFMTHGTFEADSWADSTVTTGIEAYNEGMKYIADKIGNDMYINLSIAPLFPANYAHGRRYACDTYGSINDTKYALNALTHSWWTDEVYSYNDPDYMVFGKFSGSGTYPTDYTYTNYSIGENRARFTSVVTSGLVMTGDDYVNCNDVTRERAKIILKNVEVNRIARRGKSFYPVMNGAWGSNQTDLFMQRVADTVYVAAYNLGASPVLKTNYIPIVNLGLEKGKEYTVKELWMGDTKNVVVSDTITLTVPRLDARIYKIYPSSTNAITDVDANGTIGVYPNPCLSRLQISGLEAKGLMDYRIYAVNGMCVMSLPDYGSASINVSPLAGGSYILVGKSVATGKMFSKMFVKK